MAEPLRVRVWVSADGMLRGFSADGHAAGMKDDTACAMATMLLRTAARVCKERDVSLMGSAVQPGQMCVMIEEESQWLLGVTDYLLRGMRDLQEEFPAVDLQVVTVE
jgi:hypothetical protein